MDIFALIWSGKDLFDLKLYQFLQINIISNILSKIQYDKTVHFLSYLLTKPGLVPSHLKNVDSNAGTAI